MYSIPYIIVALVLFFLYGCECGKIKCGITAKQARTIAFLLLLFFLGLRGHIYSDFINYYTFYEEVPNILKLTLRHIEDYGWEPGFVIYSSIIKTFMPNYFGWVFINTLIDLLVFRYVFKNYTRSQILPFIFFLAFNGLLIEFNLYRNIKAIDLFLLSLPYLEKRKIFPYMLLNVLGISFHLSSVIYIPLYFILNKEIPKYLKWGGIIVANVIFIFQISIISDLVNSLSVFQAMQFMDKLTGYVENSEAAQVFSLGYFERTFSIVTFTLLYSKLVKQRTSNIIFYNCFWLYYVLFLCFYEVQVLVDRIPTLFMFSYWVLYPNILGLKFNVRQLVYLSSFLLVFIKVFLSNNIPPAKYDNLLFGIEDYNTRKSIYESYVDGHF